MITDEPVGKLSYVSVKFVLTVWTMFKVRNINTANHVNPAKCQMPKVVNNLNSAVTVLTKQYNCVFVFFCFFLVQLCLTAELCNVDCFPPLK